MEITGTTREEDTRAIEYIERPHMSLPAFLSFCSQDPERFSRFDGDPQLGLSAEPAEHGRGSLLLTARPQQLQTKPDLSDVDGREIDRLLSSDRLRALHARRRPRGRYRSASPRTSQLRHAPPPTLPIGGNGGRQRFSGLVIERAIEIAAVRPGHVAALQLLPR